MVAPARLKCLRAGNTFVNPYNPTGRIFAPLTVARKEAPGRGGRSTLAQLPLPEHSQAAAVFQNLFRSPQRFLRTRSAVKFVIAPQERNDACPGWRARIFSPAHEFDRPGRQAHERPQDQ